MELYPPYLIRPHYFPSNYGHIREVAIGERGKLMYSSSGKNLIFFTLRSRWRVTKRGPTV